MNLRSWCFEIILIFYFPSYIEPDKCINSKDIIVRKRNFYIGEDELPIHIEVSKRVTHRLVSYIFQILLKEVIGYPDAFLVQPKHELISDKATHTLQRISNCINPKQCNQGGVPKVMINLEVWLPPNFNVKDWVATGEVEDCGPLGPIGRSGWFVPKYAVSELWQVNHSVIDHWRAFKNIDLVARFDLSYLNIESFTIEPEGNATYCKEKCDADGVYRPLKCRHSNIRCATLLAGYPESYTLLTEQIVELGLLVNVAWVGKNLLALIKQQIANKKYAVYFHENPTLVSNLTDASSVSFPPCEENRKYCKFDTFRMEKLAWSKVKTNAPLIFHALRSMSFSQSSYVDLLGRYNAGMFRGYSERDIACNWIRENYITWDKWVPDGISDKTTLYIGGIFPLTGVYFKQSGVIPAARMAVDAVNRNASLLPEYQLQLLEKDGHCTPDEVMMSYIDYVTNYTYKTMVGILGPTCTDSVEPVAGVAKHFNSIIISYGAEGSIFSDREKYPYFFRTIPENNQYRTVYLKLLQHLEWKRIAALTEDGKKYPKYISLLQDLLQSNGMTFIVNRKFPSERSDQDMKTYLKELKDKNAKIIIGDFYDHEARSVMCEAYKMGMTASHGYQWFLPLWFTSDWFDTDLHNSRASQPYEHVPCTTEEMIEAINGHMSLAYKFYADDGDQMQEGKTVLDWMEAYKQLAKQQKKEVSRYGGYAYDAVWLYAKALDVLLKENDSHVATLHTPKTSRRLAEIINETSFIGVSGPLNFRGSSRISEIVIWQWLKRTTFQIGVYRPISEDDGTLEMFDSKIVWLTRDHKKPSDGSKDERSCAVEEFRKFLNVTCDSAVVFINVIAFAGLVAIGSFAVIWFKRKYDQRMKMTEARMKELGLMASNGLFALDEWEMPRNRIVINRKLGEGAFGTVYGGEAHIENKGWVAVAVKTLKLGAKTEEKLDFLSEAEIMKKFNHMNIVQLIGVCTMGEPVYTVMEFMLYGDLKTFLLARRNLVTEVDRTKCDEVSDRRLTNMALDVARGLSYLANLKYVHRDLACRNCLVTAARTVKIGDFGMCRAMYDSDYYRFNKRGLLPVRWMAPESLTDGIFTPMSDVWSYGVLLYEIVTFGSFPYQGLSNTQVLEYVKKQNTLTVPKGCKLDLEHLLQKCWSKNPQERPQAAEIVEILANESELISPCLDMPMASVEVENSNSLELAIHDRSRVHSVSSLWHHRRRVSAPDTVLNDVTDPPQILITVENGALGSQADRKHSCPKFRSVSPQKNFKTESKELKYERGLSNNVYQITHL